MVDKVHGSISVVAESNFLVHKYFVGEGVEDFGLLVLRRVGFGGVRGAAQGMVFCWAPCACLERCCKGGKGESKKGKEGCRMHCRYVGWRLGWDRWWKQGRTFVEGGSDVRSDES